VGFNKKYLGVLLLVFAYGCEYEDIRLSISNTATNNLHIAFARDTVLNYPETLTFNEPDDKATYTRDVFVQTTENISMRGKNYWSELVQRSENEKLHLYVITDDVFRANDWETIRTKNLYKRVDYSLPQLEKLNWVIDIN
jgi:hypothetical protein